MRRRRNDESGFTLIEVLVVVVVLPVIIGAIALGFVTTLQNKDATQTRFSDSHDAQITSAFFVRDVKSADAVSTSSVSMCNTTAYLVGFSWSSLDSSGASVTNTAIYTVNPTTGTIDRTFCQSSSTSSVTIVHNSIPAGSGATVTTCPNSGLGVGGTRCAVGGGTAYAAVTVSCDDGTTTCANSAPVSTTPHTTNSGVDAVSIDVLESTSGFTYHVNASPSGWNSGWAGGTGGGTGSVPAVELIGTTSTASFSGSSSCSLTVNGTAAFNNTSSGSVTMGSNNALTATGGIYSAASNPINGGTVTTTTTTVGPPLADPYANLTPPSASDAGVHVEPANWSPSGQLDGVYIVTGGMSTSGSITSGPNGVLLYVTGGSVNLTGNGTTTLTKPTAKYSPIMIWIAAGNTNGSVSLGGNGNVTTIGGTIYAPNGMVALNGGGNGGGVSAGAILANKLTCSGGGNSAGFTAGPTGTCTTVAASPNPGVDSATATLTATVTDCNGNPVTSGYVAFSVATNAGTTTSDCPAPVALNSSGKAVCTTGPLSASSGPYTVKAAYQGTANYGPSTSPALSLPVYIKTTTTVTSSAASGSSTGQSVTFTATVTAANGATPTGSVTFVVQGSDGSTVTCTGGNSPTLSNGQATCSTSALVAAKSAYTVTATYPQTGSLLGSSGSLQQTVTPAATTTTVISSRPTSRAASSVTFTATVAPTPDAGTVTWSIKASDNSTVACTSTTALSSGKATCTVAGGTFTTAKAPYTVTATYGGSTNYAGSSGNTTQNIGAVTTTSTGAYTKNGNNYKSTIVVVATDGSVPTGTVNFYLCANTTTGCTPSGSPFGTGTLNASGTATSGNAPGLVAGTNYCFAVVYQGTANQYLSSQDTTAATQCFTR